ncbi:sugar ABC transporter permease YjfF [Christensenellaceae bacterium OttesenSCG-928-L17]|nr:sugar ABC transporter permease YjfF [Christensenellaceae bacterium OttesenSCG-928-L17]
MKTNSAAARGRNGQLKREPLTDTGLLLRITVCIFFGMYLLAMAIWGGGFLRPQQLFDIFNNNASLIVVACGLTIVMIAGGIDISVGGITALVVMSAVVHLDDAGGSVLSAILVSLGIGLAFGLVHGYLVSYLEIQPFIVTLAGMFFARGMTTIVSVEPRTAQHAGFLALKDARIEIPWLGYTAKNGDLIPARLEIGVLIALAVVALVFVLLKWTKLGRNFYAVGGNRQSALMLGINVRRTRFFSYLLSGLLSGIGGFVFLMHTGAGNATNAAGAEMNAIASAIIGGTLLTGGVGSVIGSLFGVLTLQTIKSIVVASGLREPWWQSITTGAMLCFFILLQSVVLSNRGKGGKKLAMPAWLRPKKEIR